MQNKSLNGYQINIYPWNKGYNEDPIDVNNVWQVLDWCRQINRFHLNNDTGDILYRWNIGVYQLAYIKRMFDNGKYDKTDFSESIASCFIHVNSAFMECNIGIYDDKIDFNYINNNYSSCQTLDYILALIPSITRQIYYKVNHRNNRFDKRELYKNVIQFNRALINLNNKNGVDFTVGLLIAMQKLQDMEFKQH